MLRKWLLIVLAVLSLALTVLPGCVKVDGGDEPQIEAGSDGTGIRVNQ